MFLTQISAKIVLTVFFEFNSKKRFSKNLQLRFKIQNEKAGARCGDWSKSGEVAIRRILSHFVTVQRGSVMLMRNTRPMLPPPPYSTFHFVVNIALVHNILDAEE